MLQKFAKIGVGTLGVLAVFLGVSGTAHATPHAASSHPARVSRTAAFRGTVPNAKSFRLASAPRTVRPADTFGGYCSDVTYNLGGTFYCDPVGGDTGETWYAFPNGALQLFVIGTDNAVWTRWSNAAVTSWSGWTSMGGSATSYVYYHGSGYTPTIDVVGSDNKTWYHRTRSSSGSWTGWQAGQ
jgi:hypothetical protein